MKATKETPKGHQEDSTGHMNGVGHHHGSTGWTNGQGHQKFHGEDDDCPEDHEDHEDHASLIDVLLYPPEDEEEQIEDEHQEDGELDFI